MNIKFLLFILLVSFSSNLFSQQTATDVEHEFGYLIGNNNDFHWGINADADSIQRMHIKTVTEKTVDNNGKRTEVKYYNSKGQLTKSEAHDHDYDFVFLYSYSESGQLLSTAQYTNKKLMTLDSNIYNQSGEVIRELHYGENNKLISTFEITYDNSGHSIIGKGKYPNGSTEQDEYNSDNLGQMKSTFRIFCDSLGKCDTTMKCVITRDNSNRVIAIHQFDKSSGFAEVAFAEVAIGSTPAQFHYSKTDCIFIYNDQGLIIQKDYDFSDNKTLSSFSYDAQKRLLKEEIIHNEKDTIRKIHYYSTITHTDSVVMPYRNTFDNALSQNDIEVNTYDDKGHKIKWERLYGNIGGTPSPSEKQEMKFDKQGHLLETKGMHVDLMSNTEDYILNGFVEYRYAKNGLVKEWYGINKSGKTEYSYKYNYTFYK
jgi:hypothetical protein